MNYDGSVRRTDLSLRSKYPYLGTKIFKISKTDFLIYVSNFQGDFDALKEEFAKSIKPLTAPIKLTQDFKDTNKYELPTISDQEIVGDFEGVLFTLFDLSNIVECKFQGVEVSSIKELIDDKKIILTLKGELTNLVITKISEFLKKTKPIFEIIVEDNGDSEKNKLPVINQFRIQSATSLKKIKSKYLERDETIWFDNIEDIYSGKFKKENLYFYSPKVTSCFIDFTVFKNINIRNHLLLYDVIYCTLPVNVNTEEFLTSQRLSKDDFLYLVQKGRLKVINSQPETRLDFNFLNDIYQVDETAVISRRAISTLCATEIVLTNKQYILNDPDLENFITPLAEIISKKLQIDFNKVIGFFLWPKTALRNSFQSLNLSGTKGFPEFGVNNVIADIFLAGRKDHGGKLEFEFTISSEPIHIAHALDATYFPFIVENNKYSDHPYASVMGMMLNFFKHMNFLNLREYIEHFETIHSTNKTLDLINIFEINDYIPIDEFEKESSNLFQRRGLGALFSELRGLKTEERAIRIKNYNQKVQDLLNRKKNNKFYLDLGEDTVGQAIPYFSTILKAGNFIKNKTFDESQMAFEFFEALQSKIKQNPEEKNKISLLSKINRVARLKKG